MLVSNNWEPDLVLEMEDHYRTAFCIMNQERNSQTGAKFNTKTMKWDAPKKP